VTQLEIGPYLIERIETRVEVARRPSWVSRLLALLGFSAPSPLLVLLGPSQLGEVTTEKRALRGPDRKRPQSSRPWLVRVEDPQGVPLRQPSFQFRNQADARRFEQALRRYKNGEAWA